jgi:AP2 domain/HNH endonuclease
MKNKKPIRVEGNIAYVTLTKGYVAVLDAADVSLVEGANWHAEVKPRTVYAVSQSSRDADGKRRMIRLHRALMNAPPDMDVDHRNGHGLDNRRDNLRLATCQQNQYNQRIHRNNTSGFKGVYWYTRIGKWRAMITHDGKQQHLGYHATPEAAYAAYCEASARLHGDFGRVV